MEKSILYIREPINICVQQLERLPEAQRYERNWKNYLKQINRIHTITFLNQNLYVFIFYCKRMLIIERKCSLYSESVLCDYTFEAPGYGNLLDSLSPAVLHETESTML